MKKAAFVLTIITSFSLISACNSLTDSKTHYQVRPSIGSTNNSLQQYSATEFFKTTSIVGSSINYDNSAVLVTSDSSGVYNVYRYPVDGSEPTKLTESDNNANYSVGWFPADDRILFTADQGGNELNHLYVRELDGRVKDPYAGWEPKGAFFRLEKRR